MIDDHVFTRRFAPATQRTDGPLAKVSITIKDLLDVEGYPTRAGSRAFHDAPPATRDATAVARLRAAGATLLGHTTMTELAYSGLGLNASGTPDNPRWPGHIPGGSTSGGAASVALDIARIAIGTDTGGSVRIPAAFCGLAGFKPTRASVPRDGCVPLSPSLDSIGPIARTVADCELAWRIMAGQVIASSDASARTAGEAPRLIIPANFATDDIEPAVAAAFDGARRRLEGAGITLETRALDVLDAYANHAVWHYSAVESRACHATLWAERRDRLEPRIRRRMARGDEVTAIDYARTLIERDWLIEAFERELGDDMLVMPSVAIVPPEPGPLEDEAAYDRTNLLALRHTSLANILDGCSISLPISPDGPPVGLMLVAARGADERLLAVARRIERSLGA